MELKRYFSAFGVAILIVVVLNLLNEYALTFKIPQFFIGWSSCTGYFAVINYRKSVTNN